jgi:hypothetical protein
MSRARLGGHAIHWFVHLEMCCPELRCLQSARDSMRALVGMCPKLERLRISSLGGGPLAFIGGLQGPFEPAPAPPSETFT